MTSWKPYVAQIEVAPSVQAEKLSVQVTFRRSEQGLKRGWSFSDGIELPRITPAQGAKEAYEISVNAAALAEGEYVGEISVAAGAAKTAQPITFFRMAEGKPADFPFGIYATPFGKTKEEQQATLDAIHATGINLLCQHMAGMESYAWIYDRAARLGMRFMPSTNTLGFNLKLDDAVRVRTNTGEVLKWPTACMNRPETRKLASEYFVKFVQAYKTHPAFSGMIYYGDDLVVGSKSVPDGVDLGCYCDYCKAEFKRLTGQDPPARQDCQKRAGVIPANDLLLQWMRYRCADMYGGFVAEMRKPKDSVDPSVAIGLCHGWSEQPYINLASGVYSPLHDQAADVVSSYCYPMLRSARMDFIPHYEMAKMGNRGKDVWMLGILGMFSTIWPEWSVDQNYWNMLASGYKFIGYFSWGDLMGCKNKEVVNEAIAALAKCGKHKDWILPTAAYWQQPECRNAVLYSFTTEACDLVPESRGIEHLKEVLEFYHEVLRQHLPMKIISEEEIRAGILKDFDNVCIYGVRALPDDVNKALEDYAATDGKALYVHDRSPLKPKGALAMSMESMIAVVRNKTNPPVDVADRDVAVRKFLAGNSATDGANTAHYYVFVNNSADYYWGIPFDYKDQSVNYDRAKLLRDRAIDTTARFTAKDRWLFDLSTGQRLGRTSEPLAFKLEPSWGRVIAVLPSKEAELKLSGPSSVKTGETARIQIAMLGDDGKPISGAFTLKADVATPSGRASRYSGYFGIKDGLGEMRLPIGLNDELGKWTVTIEGGFPRKQKTASLRVLEGPKLGEIAAVHPVSQAE